MDALSLTYQVVQALAAKKGRDLLILDLRGLTVIADYFVIVTAASTVQSRALFEGVLEAVRTSGIKSVRPEGTGESGWVLLDLGDVIVHIFDAEQRDFYQLERLWADAPRIPLPEDVT